MNPQQEQLLADINNTCGRIEGRMEGMHAEIAALGRAKNGHEARISTLERKAAWAAGVAAVISAVVAFVVQLVRG